MRRSAIESRALFTRQCKMELAGRPAKRAYGRRVKLVPQGAPLTLSLQGAWLGSVNTIAPGLGARGDRNARN
ncbi:MAG TPA: hypothetical protein VLJ39_16035 [Tepidisphaeraceae bacterium]|nr:hypothetical protein [Tepidisphaeraceae bacterium]